MEIKNSEYIEIPDKVLPKCLSDKRVPLENQANDDDWKRLQRGKPKLVPHLYDKDGNLLSVKVIHEYREDLSDDEKTVITSLYIARKWDEEGNSYVRHTINGREVFFPTALVLACHGGPCKERSRNIR